ncbi:MAG: hypothetical protein K2H45_07440, partial [Acetatifactor sp.]|nr:hypothetical protein [Acetatifactor sp.]
IVEFFDKCCFLSQDEHLQFLKETQKDKTVALEFLFQLPEKQYKELDRVNEILHSLKNANIKNNLGYFRKLDNTRNNLSNEIEGLEKKFKENYIDQDMAERVGTEYRLLFPDRGIKWDKENPVLSDEELVEALKTIDSLEYYAQNQEACRNYIWNKPFRDLIAPFKGTENILYEGNVLEYAFRYFPLAINSETLEAKYHKQQQLELLGRNLEEREIHKINWAVVASEKLLQEDMIESAEKEISQVESLEKVQGTIDKVITEINKTRTILLQQTKDAVDQNTIVGGECPFCGYSYGKTEILEEHILAEREKLLSIGEGTSKDIQDRIDDIYEKYLNGIAALIQVRLQDRISETTYKKCQEVKRYKVDLNKVNELLQKMNLSLPMEYQEEMTQIARGYESLVQNIESGLKKIPAEIQEQLDSRDFAGDFEQYYDKNEDKFSANTFFLLQAKREYIKKMLYDSIRKIIVSKKNELLKIERRYKKLQEIYKMLSNYKEAIEAGVIDYKRSVVQDIEPLLHVYTAKILQQKFCGKSIFISTDKNMQKFQLINSEEDNQDILYNMSSGQLAAVSLSFLLCMHQVYAKQQSLPILLIDDPIQTIDDVNMVGLVDILRFEFQNTQIFISTHEQKFEWYLKYKYEKAQKEIESYNMKNIVLEQIDNMSKSYS